MSKRTDEEVHPFSTGTQYMDWDDENCCHCWKVHWSRKDKDMPSSSCAIWNALSIGSITGTIPLRIARRMGLFEHLGAYCWECPEREENRPPQPKRVRGLELMEKMI
jgi:hypothetical protein